MMLYKANFVYSNHGWNTNWLNTLLIGFKGNPNDHLNKVRIFLIPKRGEKCLLSTIVDMLMVEKPKYDLTLYSLWLQSVCSYSGFCYSNTVCSNNKYFNKESNKAKAIITIVNKVNRTTSPMGLFIVFTNWVVLLFYF